jgi:tRNA A37 threonylcarbamoyladenosine modification protein TsaB
MWLFIDTHNRGEVHFAVLPIKGKIRSKIIQKPRVNVPSALAAFVDPAELATLSGVCVVAGPGSFSAVRAGVLAGNLIARLVNKPLMGVSVDEAVDLGVLRQRLVDGSIEASTYVAPVYDAEPNITC